MLRIGVIGYGYWGPNLVRNFSESLNATVTMVADLDPARLALVSRRFPTVRTTTSFAELIADPDVDAVAVATPVRTHFAIGMAVLGAGKHLWLEKPMTETVDEAMRLADEADRLNLVYTEDGFEAGEEEIYVGDMARGIAQGLAHDPKAVERQLASPG